VIVQFKGREIQYKDLGRDLLLKLFKPVEEIALVEAPPKVEGKSMTMLLGPKKTK
jgi:translation initiation factor IF-3